MKNLFNRLLIKQSLKSYAVKIKQMPWFLGRNAFLFILIFILASIIFGEILFYKYVFLQKIKDQNSIDISTKFNEDVYQSVLRGMEDRENNFNNADQKNYRNPF